MKQPPAVGRNTKGKRVYEYERSINNGGRFGALFVWHACHE